MRRIKFEKRKGRKDMETRVLIVQEMTISTCYVDETSMVCSPRCEDKPGQEREAKTGGRGGKETRKSGGEENGNIRMLKEISETAIELSGKEKKA